VGGRFRWRRAQDFTFAEYVAAARRSYLARKETKKMTEGMVQCDQMTVET